jgi:hypothetical protein
MEKNEILDTWENWKNDTSWHDLYYDIFIYLIETGKLKQKDLINLSLSSCIILNKCNHKNKRLWYFVLHRDFNIIWKDLHPEKYTIYFLIFILNIILRIMKQHLKLLVNLITSK